MFVNKNDRFLYLVCDCFGRGFDLFITTFWHCAPILLRSRARKCKLAEKVLRGRIQIGKIEKEIFLRGLKDFEYRLYAMFNILLIFTISVKTQHQKLMI
jgi:hypothetical protein